MNTISFSKPQKLSGFNSRCDKLLFQLMVGGKSDMIFFEVPIDFRAHNDCVAASLSTLCGKSFNRIEFDFPVSDHCMERIEIHTKTPVGRESSCAPFKAGRKVGLNFSGGFDSFAAYLLAPNDQLRIAVDFGGWFEREEEFFRTVDPEVICRTDFRTKRYDRADWLFMAAPSILFADYLGLGSIAFGTIFEASTYNYVNSPVANDTASSPKIFQSIGLSDGTLTRGLTEFGTALIILEYVPELIDSSINSLAAPGTEKSFRKKLLIETAKYFKHGALPNFDNIEIPNQRIEFGKSFAIDFITLAFLRLYGRFEVERWVDGLNSIDMDALFEINVSWLFKFNPHYIPQIPGHMRDEVDFRLKRAGIEYFNETDWSHYESFSKFFQKYNLPSKTTNS